MPTDVLQDYVQLVRESVAAHSARLTLGLCPISAGRLVRDGNLASPPAPTGLFTKTPDNSDRLRPLLRDVTDQDATVGENEYLLLPDASTALTTNSGPTSTMGKGWGVLRRTQDPAGFAWQSSAYTDMGRGFQVIASQSGSTVLKPADLVYGGNPSAYNHLAERCVVGLDSYLGAYKSLGQAFVALAHPVAGLIDFVPSPDDSYQLPKRYGSVVVVLNAMLERFSRPQVTSAQLELYEDVNGAEPTRVLSPGDVFNPQYYGKIVARAFYNPRVDSATLELYSEANDKISSDTRSSVREAEWVMKGENVNNVFSPKLVTPYCGSIDIKVKGTVNNTDSAPVRYTFVIDTQSPDVRLLGWESNRTYRGSVSIRGTATDRHFEDYRVSVEQNGVTKSIAYSEQPVAGVGLLTTWDKNDNLSDTCRIILTATDAAGNNATTWTTVNTWNDKFKPNLSIDQPVNIGLTGIVPLRVSGSDNVPPADSGIKRLHIWIDYKESYIDVGNEFKVRDMTRDLVNMDNLTSGTFTYQTQLDTRKLQASAYSDGGLVIHAEAEDLFGNTANVSRTYNLNNAMFNVELSRSTMKIGDIAFPMRIMIYQTTPQTPKVEIVNKDGVVVKTILEPAWGPYPAYYETYSKIKVVATHYVEFGWFGEFDSGISQTPGEYKVRITPKEVGEAQELPIYLMDTANPDSKIVDPRITIVFKDENKGIVPVTGYIVNPGFEHITTPAPNTQIEKMWPASRPYWHLAYKPSGADPIIASRNILADFFSSNIKHEGNWTEIAHGYTNVADPWTTAVLANWNISGLDGSYDLRLVVTDGVVYRTLVVPNLTVATHIPPDRPIDPPGTLKLRQKDFSVKFEGFPIEIARDFNSSRAYEKSDFGYGWSIGDISLKVSNDTLDYQEKFDQKFGTMALYKLQTKIKLPDGREFTYANQPPLFNYSANFNNAFSRFNEFYRRPYGQHLWLPGYNYYAGLISLPDTVTQTDGWKQAQKYKTTHGGGIPDGSIACLQLEDGSFILFEWGSGRLLRRDMGDVMSAGSETGRILDFESQTSTSTEIHDNLGRAISIKRNDRGLVTSITDPRGFACRYAYNANDELTSVTDRVGNTRLFEYATLMAEMVGHNAFALKAALGHTRISTTERYCHPTAPILEITLPEPKKGTGAS